MDDLCAVQGWNERRNTFEQDQLKFHQFWYGDIFIIKFKYPSDVVLIVLKSIIINFYSFELMF